MSSPQQIFEKSVAWNRKQDYHYFLLWSGAACTWRHLGNKTTTAAAVYSVVWCFVLRNFITIIIKKNHSKFLVLKLSHTKGGVEKVNLRNWQGFEVNWLIWWCFIRTITGCKLCGLSNCRFCPLFHSCLTLKSKFVLTDAMVCWHTPLVGKKFNTKKTNVVGIELVWQIFNWNERGLFDC